MLMMAKHWRVKASFGLALKQFHLCAQAAKVLFEQHKIPVVNLRLFNVYGPGMSLNDYRIIPNITRSLVLNEQLKIYDTGAQTRTYCYVSDAISGFLKVIFHLHIY